MLKFLVSVLLAILIFTPTCIFGSKFFRLSSQAKDNFNDVVSTIKQVAQQEGDVKTVLLIMDGDTALLTFEKGKGHEVTYRTCESKSGVETCEEKPYRITYQDTPVSPVRKEIHTTYTYPDQCFGKDCICLCQEREVQGTQQEGAQVVFETATCTQILCSPIGDLSVKKFYHYRSEDDPRRTFLEVKNDNGDIVLTSQR